MNVRRCFFSRNGLWLVAALLGCCTSRSLAQAPPVNESRAQEERREKDLCRKNLRLIWEAIQAYRQKNKDIPNWLSDLVPDYLADSDVLLCPVSKRFGLIYNIGIPDPERRSSYHYEFCPRPVEVWGGSTRTMREWKRRQMGLLGGRVPIVRCHFHRASLNLGFDGEIYESALDWEDQFTDRINLDDLTPARLFASERPVQAPSNAPPARASLRNKFLPRDPAAGAGQLDLTPWYYAPLTVSWLTGQPGDNLASFPAGLVTLGAVRFDARGVLQLSSGKTNAESFPAGVSGIPVNQAGRRLHCLLGAAGEPIDEGRSIAKIVLHFADHRDLGLPILFARQVALWKFPAGEVTPASTCQAAWTGTNGCTQTTGQAVRLYQISWEIPYVSSVSLDLVSEQCGVAPFFVAITIDP